MQILLSMIIFVESIETWSLCFQNFKNCYIVLDLLKINQIGLGSDIPQLLGGGGKKPWFYVLKDLSLQ